MRPGTRRFDSPDLVRAACTELERAAGLNRDPAVDACLVATYRRLAQARRQFEAEASEIDRSIAELDAQISLARTPLQAEGIH